MSLEDPGLVESFREVVEGFKQLRDGVEASEPEQLLLERSDEALDAAVAFGAADEAGAAADAEEGDFLLKGVGDELAAVVVAELKLGSDDALREAAEDAADRLTDRLEGLEADAAGVTRWGSKFQTLRASCEKEWAERHPQIAVSRWLGHGIAVSGKHYLNDELSESVFRRAAGLPEAAPVGLPEPVRRAANALPPVAESSGIERNDGKRPESVPKRKPRRMRGLPQTTGLSR